MTDNILSFSKCAPDAEAASRVSGETPPAPVEGAPGNLRSYALLAVFASGEVGVGQIPVHIGDKTPQQIFPAVVRDVFGPPGRAAPGFRFGIVVGPAMRRKGSQ